LHCKIILYSILNAPTTKKNKTVFLSTLALILASSSQTKQFDSYSEVTSDLKISNYSDLEKEFGAPANIKLSGLEYCVTWNGVGVNGRDGNDI
jgi:hypothetical protein